MPLYRCIILPMLVIRHGTPQCWWAIYTRFLNKCKHIAGGLRQHRGLLQWLLLPGPSQHKLGMSSMHRVSAWGEKSSVTRPLS